MLYCKPMDVIDDLLTRGVTAVYPNPKAFKKRLLKKTPLKIYLGVDPSGAVLHLGHSVVLRKLRIFQDLGHQVILLIGDFTGRIGDPTDKSAARPKLSHQQVLKNAASYRRQTSKILKFGGPNRAKLAYNSRWHDRLSFAEVIKLASYFTVQQLQEREMFQKRRRLKKPIYLHEFLYPVLQAYDSVALEVDAELGGSDQIFNMLTGRELVRALLRKEKYVLATKLLVGSDGQKMGKSLANFIPITAEPGEMFGRVMTIKDQLIIHYFTLATSLPLVKINQIEKNLKSKNLSPMAAKKQLAFEIVKLYHGQVKAARAQREFTRVFQQKLAPSRVPLIRVRSQGDPLLKLVLGTGLVTSKSEAKRLIKSGGVRLDRRKIRNPDQKITPQSGQIIKIGKHNFGKISPE